MRRRALGAVVSLVLAVMSVFAASPADAATTQQTFLTFYGWWDNTPPGGDISFPQIHDTAGGKGTFDDPITFATATAELKAGTKVWVPRVRKYFIMEDGCDECDQDWNGHGPNGGPNLRHIDLWLGGQGGSAMDAIDCEDALTHYNADNTPVMEPVVVDPPSNEDFDATPIFNTSTGECYGGAQPNKTVGAYKNVSTGMCMEDPNNSSSSGTQMKTAPCSGSAAQEFTFHGAFFVKNNMCLGNSSGKIVLQSCTAGPNQQWSVNPSNKTISDIQTSKKCFRDASGSVTAGSCSGTPSQWDFTASGGTNDFSVNVSPGSGSITGGGSVTSTVTTTGTGSIALSASNVPAGATVTFTPSTVTAGGTSTLKVATTADAPAGTYPITVTGTAAGTSHTATYTLTVGGSGPGQPVLLSQGQPATASSLESSSFPAGNAFDGDLTKTRWASKEGSDPQWLRIDLGSTAAISRVKLTWEAAYAKSYTIQTSPDGSVWTTIYTTSTGNGGTDDLTGLSGTGRYVRMNGTVRGTQYGYSLYEMQVYGTR